MTNHAQRETLTNLFSGSCDPRRQYWGWDEEGRRLRLRPGPAAGKIRDLLAAQGVELEIQVLDREESYCVTTTWTSLRASPSHGAEQISQLRLGQPFRVWTRDGSGDWCLGAGPDGYPGWIRNWHLRSGIADPPDHVVSARSSRALSAARGDSTLLLDLSFATGIRASGPQRDGFLPWQLPDGREAWTALSDLDECARAHEDAPKQVLGWAGNLLGIPYEWGGSTSRGFDCSGLVQALYWAAGTVLPRDADLQAEQGAQRDRNEAALWQAGDLLCFGEEKVDHVGLLLDDGGLLHASGCVKIEELAANHRLQGRELRAVVDPLSFELPR